MGKRKIAIERVKECKRYVTFSKRKTGLFSKASTACKKCGSEIAIILFSPTGKPYVFGPVDSLIDRFLHHQSSSSSSLIPPPHPNFFSEAATDQDHIEGGKKRSRSCNGDDLIAERKMKKRKLLMITEATAAEEEEEEEQEKEGFLMTGSETEEGLMKNGFMGNVDCCCSSLLMSTEATATATATEEEEQEKEGFLLTSSETEEGLMKNGFMGTVVADDGCSSFPPDVSLMSDDELNETLSGFADYITTDHHQNHELNETLSGFADSITTDHHQNHELNETLSGFDLLPHQGVYYDEDAFPFSGNWGS